MDPLIIENFSAEDKGVYICKITNPQLPDLMLESEIFHLMVTSLNTIGQNVVKIYPNPSIGQFTINFDKLPGQSTRVEISGIDGKLIYLGKIINNQQQINLQNIKQGMYLLKIFDNDKLYGTYKMMISK